jgi:hypothetical protein
MKRILVAVAFALLPVTVSPVLAQPRPSNVDTALAARPDPELKCFYFHPFWVCLPL